MSLTGLSFWRTDPYPVGGITAVPPPHCAKCPFGQKYGSCRFECVDAVEKAIQTSTSGKPAAMFVEPVQGNGGIVAPPPEYFPRLKALLEKYGALLIADEVQTGFGRTGKMFAMDHWNVCPDIITGGKSLGGGTPMGYFATNEKIAASFTRPSGSTFGGNPVTSVAGIAFLRILLRDRLVERAAQLGTVLKTRLDAIAKQSDLIEEVRGLGVMLGLELRGRGEKSPAQVTDWVLEEMKNKGFLLGKTGPGRNVLTFMPPFIATENQLLQAAESLENILDSVSQ
jgi:4-aminobutyrate aminotransferase-like enzyme